MYMSLGVASLLKISVLKMHKKYILSNNIFCNIDGNKSFSGLVSKYKDR